MADDLHSRAQTVDRLRANLCRVIIGKQAEIELLLAGLLGGGHILLEDIPGVGKTTLAKALAQSVGGRFSRVQFTPDLLPTDIIGASIYNPSDNKFHFRPGPILTNILLADEINRASPRTQSALLEAMAEKQVTVDGRARALGSPFLVIATQNPIESHGTYPLPESQLDRFAVRLSLGYPPPEEEMRILHNEGGAELLTELRQVVDPPGLVKLQQAAAEVALEQSVADYLLGLVRATRSHSSVALGVSPRGALALLATARALALCRGRDHLVPDDVKSVAPVVLAHRMVLDSKARYAGVATKVVVEEILGRQRIPR